jgi:hypothetical protein
LGFVGIAMRVDKQIDKKLREINSRCKPNQAKKIVKLAKKSSSSKRELITKLWFYDIMRHTK